MCGFDYRTLCVYNRFIFLIGITANSVRRKVVVMVDDMAVRGGKSGRSRDPAVSKTWARASRRSVESNNNKVKKGVLMPLNLLWFHWQSDSVGFSPSELMRLNLSFVIMSAAERRGISMCPCLWVRMSLWLNLVTMISHDLVTGCGPNLYDRYFTESSSCDLSFRGRGSKVEATRVYSLGRVLYKHFFFMYLSRLLFACVCVYQWWVCVCNYLRMCKGCVFMHGYKL